MLPALLWLAVGVVASVLTGMRAQLLLLERFPQGDWMVACGGLLIGGLVLGVALVTVFTCRSLKRTGLLLLAVPLVVAGAGLAGILRFPESHFKDGQVAEEWRQLHPTLRLALWVVTLEDWSVVLTDIARTPEEYAAKGDSIYPGAATGVGLGPEPPDGSKHYVDEDGYARAVDLRVGDAGPLRNWIRQGLFLMMGLDTLRHEGTADHLHVALPG